MLAPSLSSARILVIDDDRYATLLLERVLSAAGYTNVTSATNPVAALATYREVSPDLVVLDLNMPGLSGLDVMDRLMAMEPDGMPPVLMLTGQGDVRTRVAALERGARDFLSKPVDRSELLVRVRNLLESRALHTAATAERRRAELSAADSNRDLLEARVEMMRRLALTADSRDGDTGQHLARVSRYVGLLGRAAGLREEQVTQLELAAPLHDVGKIAIPDAILGKRGPLDPAERAIMRTHTTTGAMLLGGSQWPELQMAERIALTHHERWDGSGYPSGLAGDQIPLEGRICALVDVFDALTSTRPYKSAWTTDAAGAELRRLRGIHFDPELTDVFLKHLHAFAAVRLEFAA